MRQADTDTENGAQRGPGSWERPWEVGLDSVTMGGGKPGK